ncbi:hypothetical protein VSR34_32985 [Paraburkholderia sp. JHI2823]|uniref:hypothetical protein n=1 Tax=Paraburkholderia sp. JHI2823 TaxID=3112960 RepID=UPI0031717D11
MHSFGIHCADEAAVSEAPSPCDIFLPDFEDFGFMVFVPLELDVLPVTPLALGAPGAALPGAAAPGSSTAAIGALRSLPAKAMHAVNAMTPILLVVLSPP